MVAFSTLTFILAVISSISAVKDGQEFKNGFQPENDYVQEPETVQTGNSAWPLQGDFGDVSSLAIHPNGELFYLHRGPNQWREGTFNESNVYQDFDLGPIPVDVLVGVDAETGEERHQWGRNRNLNPRNLIPRGEKLMKFWSELMVTRWMTASESLGQLALEEGFFMPHGLFIGKDGSFWITDVALHQVFKVDSITLEVSLELGEAGIPGAGRDHFCKPTDVAVVSTGNIFISDGYCNSRIVQFSADGKYVSEFGRSADPSIFPAPMDTLNIPHSLAYIPLYDMLCVANREEEKIQCFSAGTQKDVPAGQFITQVAHSALSRVFAISYNEKLNKLYAVNGVGFSLEDKPLEIFSIDLTTNSIQSWNPEADGVEFVAPHDIAVSEDGKSIFVADMASRPRIWKFNNGDAQK